MDQAVNEMQSDLIKMRQSSAQVLASQKQIEAKYNQSRDTAVSPLLKAEQFDESYCSADLHGIKIIDVVNYEFAPGCI